MMAWRPGFYMIRSVESDNAATGWKDRASRWRLGGGACAGATTLLLIFAMAVPFMSWALATAPALAILQWVILEKSKVWDGKRTWLSGIGFGSLAALLFCAVLTASMFFLDRGSKWMTTSVVAVAFILAPTVAPVLVVRGVVAMSLFVIAALAVGSIVFAEELFDPSKYRDTGMEFAIVMAGLAVFFWIVGWIAFAIERKHRLATIGAALLLALIAIASFALGLA